LRNGKQSFCLGKYSEIGYLCNKIRSTNWPNIGKRFFLSKKRQLIGWSEIEDMNGIMGSTANYRNE